MKTILLIILLVAVHGYDSPMSVFESKAFQVVADTCDEDVAFLCDGFSPLPFLFKPVGSPLDDLVVIMDRMMRMPIEMESSFVLVFEGEMNPIEDETVDSVVSELAANTHATDLEELSQRLVDHGEMVLNSEDAPQVQRRMARRLMEVAATPESIVALRDEWLPFGCEWRNRCMQAAYRRGAVSHPCGAAIQELERVRMIEYSDRLRDIDRLAQFSAMVFLVLVSMLVLRCRGRTEMKEKRILKRRILKAVYSRPELKSALEKELGESLGHVPPLPWTALLRMGRSGRVFRKKMKACRRFRMMSYIATFFLAVFAPSVLLFLGGLVASFWCVSALLLPKPVAECSCCCCGADTEAVKKGLLNEAQSCCACCQGTAICSVQCCCCNSGSGGVAGCCSCCSSSESPAASSDGCCSGMACCGGCCCCKATTAGQAECCCCCTSATPGGAGCCDGCCCCKASSLGGTGCCDGCCCCKASSLEGSACCDGCCCCKASTPKGGECDSELANTTVHCGNCCKAEKRTSGEATRVAVVCEGVPIQVV